MTTEAQAKRAANVRKRLATNFEYYAEHCLKILTKPDPSGVSSIVPFKFNAAQRFVHKQIEQQREDKGYIRAIILKGRQQGVSTYVEGRFYWKTSNRIGQKTYILTHKAEATDNLFKMAERYHDNAPTHMKPHVGKKNAKEFEFDRLDSKYQVATAGAKGAGRSATLINVHGSEVAFWENAQSHLGGMLQAVPLAKDTEVLLESTAQGLGNVFHKQWLMAVKGQSDFIAIFVPWFWQEEYRRDPPSNFALEGSTESAPEGELTEEEYAHFFKCDLAQMYWRRMKIAELGGGEDGYYTFKEEYPATADEAFQSSQSGNTLMKRNQILKARKSDVGGSGDLIIGVDPGGEGEGGDPTGIIRRRGRKLFNPQVITKLNTMQIAALVHTIITKEKPKRVFIDVGGLGKGVYDRLMEMPGSAGIVVLVNFGGASSNPDLYKNHRAEMHWKQKEWIEDIGGANIPDDDQIQTEFMASVISPPDSLQRRQLRSKEWMKSQGIASPNLADAGALTHAYPVAAGSHQQGNSMQDFDPLSGDISENANFDPLDY